MQQHLSVCNNFASDCVILQGVQKISCLSNAGVTVGNSHASHLFDSHARIFLASQPFRRWYKFCCITFVNISDFVQCLGLVTIAYMLVHNNVEPGGMCTLQGFLIQSGDIASAIWSFIIAVHTFVLLAGGRRWRAWVAEKSTAGKGRWILCFCVWFVVLFIGTIGLMLIQKLYPWKGPFCTFLSLNSDLIQFRQQCGRRLVLD